MSMMTSMHANVSDTAVLAAFRFVKSDSNKFCWMTQVVQHITITSGNACCHRHWWECIWINETQIFWQLKCGVKNYFYHCGECLPLRRIWLRQGSMFGVRRQLLMLLLQNRFGERIVGWMQKCFCQIQVFVELLVSLLRFFSVMKRLLF